MPDRQTPTGQDAAPRKPVSADPAAAQPKPRHVVRIDRLAGPAIVAAAVALVSLVTTTAFVGWPQARQIVAGLWSGTPPIRSLDLGGAPGETELAARRDDLRRSLALLGDDTDIVTGSIGSASSAPPAAGLGADIGGGDRLATFRATWTGLSASLKADFPAVLPLVAIRDSAAGHELRLVLGPVADAADLARLCKRLGRSGTECRPVPYEGQRLSPG